MAEPTTWRRYVAMGDSLTEGLVDPYPDGSPRGWADRFAGHLAAAAGEPLQYANLAIRGQLLRPIIAEQLDAAVALKPDLVTISAGGNDVIRPGTDPDAMMSLSRAPCTSSITMYGAGWVPEASVTVSS